MTLSNKDRAANIRRNLRRWWKPLLGILIGWFVLSVAVCGVMITYAYKHHFSEARIRMLGESCGTAMAFLLGIVVLVVLVLADRRKSE